MSYFTEVLWPYMLLGAVSSAAVLLYQTAWNGKSAQQFVNGAIDKLLKVINLSSTDGAGQIIAKAIQFFILGGILGVAVYVTNQFAPIPTPASIVSPLGMAQ